MHTSNYLDVRIKYKYEIQQTQLKSVTQTITNIVKICDTYEFVLLISSQISVTTAGSQNF